MPDTVSPLPSTMLDRAELILDALAVEGYLTLSEVADLTGIPSSSAHRILEQMVRLRWLQRIDSCYELGVRMFELGSEAVRNHWFHRIAFRHLDELQRCTGLVVHLAFLDGADVVYWEKLGGGLGGRIPTRIGGHQPAHRTALGKALLAAEPDGSLDDPAFDVMRPGTPATICTREQLIPEVLKTRESGVAFDHGEALVGIDCIAAAVTAGHANTSDGHTTTAAVSLCGPRDRVNNRQVNQLLSTTAEISRAAFTNPLTEARHSPHRSNARAARQS